MSKLVVLKIIDGSFEQGFTVMLQIGQEAKPPAVELIGKLPPAPALPVYYRTWHERYWRLDSGFRIKSKPGQKTNVSLLDDCIQAAQQLKNTLSQWLLSEEFRPLREKWLETLSPEDDIRVIIQTEHPQLRQLPWNVLDTLDRYPKAEVALSALNTEAPPSVPPARTKSQINILAVIGDSGGIDTQADQDLLAGLPQAQVLTLVEPSREQLNETLWQQSWDILFFAGHSFSQGDRQQGTLLLNPHETLSMADLKYALRKSVANGLQLAIFNSCDGLGLARELADLRIPQVIVMREPVPDRVAQEFLKHLLQGYAAGLPLYRAVREARERLQGLEHQFPCATWLPLICQHPAVIPPTWRDFLPASSVADPWRSPPRRSLAIALLIGLGAFTLVGGLRLTGLLQPLELLAFDHMHRLRRPEPPDPRLFVVTVDDEDVRQQRQTDTLQGASISDRALSQLLTVLQQYQPAAIGLDIYRDAAQLPALANQLRHSPNLIGICKVGYDKANPYGIAPPPELPPDQFRVGFSDFVLDQDEVVRRQLLAMSSLSLVESRCQVPTAFAVELVFRYLQADLDDQHTGFAKDWDEALKIRLQSSPTVRSAVPHAYGTARSPSAQSEKLFQRLQPGLYRSQDTAGNQLLLHYRATPEPDQVAESRPLRWFLNREQPPTPEQLKALIQGRIVLIGVTARERDDFFKTPYGQGFDQRVAGVFIHAHKISQLLSAVLDDRPLLWMWAGWLEWLWIASWAIGAAILPWLLSCASRRWSGRHGQIGWAIALSLGGFVGVAYGVGASIFVLAAGWVPVIPSVLVVIASHAGVTVYLTRQTRRPVLPVNHPATALNHPIS